MFLQVAPCPLVQGRRHPAEKHHQQNLLKVLLPLPRRLSKKCAKRSLLGRCFILRLNIINLPCSQWISSISSKAICHNDVKRLPISAFPPSVGLCKERHVKEQAQNRLVSSDPLQRRPTVGFNSKRSVVAKALPICASAQNFWTYISVGSSVQKRLLTAKSKGRIQGECWALRYDTTNAKGNGSKHCSCGACEKTIGSLP